MIQATSPYGWDATMGIPLYDKIRKDMKTAMVNRDNLVRDTMRLIMGAYPDITVPITLESGKKSTRVKQPDEMTDEDILGIIRKFAKSELTVLEHKGETTSDYLELLNAYLPRMATADEIRTWIQENVDLDRFKSPMQAMGTVMGHYGRRADGRMVQEILKSMG